MPLVQAYHCPRTGAFFLDKGEYVEHLKVLARESLDKKNRVKNIAKLTKVFDAIRRDARSFDDITKGLQANMRAVKDMCNLRGWTDTPFKNAPTLRTMQFRGLHMSDKCSNTHGKPLRGVTNWGCKKDKQIGYPGITGRIFFDINRDFRFTGFLDHTLGLHCGTGGGGRDGHSYDFVIFAEDWPFIGAGSLFANRHLPLSPDLERVLEYAFPGISKEAYNHLRETGLLPDTLEDFKVYMYQFVNEVQKNAGMSATLPNDMLPLA